MTPSRDGLTAQAQFFQALSHPIRLRILDILSRQEACVCHLTCILGQRQPYVSQQLATLRDAGLVTDRRDGTLIYYRLADERLAHLLVESRAVLQDLTGVGSGSSRPLAFPPVPDEPLADCPCPRCQGEV